MDEDEAQYPDQYPEGPLNLHPCAICGRNFNVETLRKHQGICQKTASKRRKLFDSGKQRATGSDVIYEKTKETKEIQINGETAAPATGKKADWRQKHDELVRAVRNARMCDVAAKTGAPLPAFQPSAIPSDYVQCPHCGRHFNSSAAERHMPFCESQQKRQKINVSANLKQKQETRLNYQPPLPGGNRKQSSEKKSGIPKPSSGYGYNNGAVNGGNNRRATDNVTPTRPLKSSSECANRKPLKYQSQMYQDDDYADRSRATNAIQSKAANRANSFGRDDKILRTGRNMENNAINATLARRRSGPNSTKTSPMNSSNPRSPPPQMQQQQQQQQPLSYKSNFTNRRTGDTQNNSNQNNNVTRKVPGQSKFCGDCGTQFPVEWAKYCCLCGERRS